MLKKNMHQITAPCLCLAVIGELYVQYYCMLQQVEEPDYVL